MKAWAFIGLFSLFGLTSPDNSKEFFESLSEMGKKVELLESKVDSLSESNTRLWKLHPYLNNTSKKALYAHSKKEGELTNTKFKLLYSSVNPKVDMELYNALTTYTGPIVGVTSIFRQGSGKSQHHHGGAVDIKWDAVPKSGTMSGRAFARWLITDEGQAWEKEHGLWIRFENIRDKAYREGAYEKYYMYNPNATGPHVHIGLSKDKPKQALVETLLASS